MNNYDAGQAQVDGRTEESWSYGEADELSSNSRRKCKPPYVTRLGFVLLFELGYLRCIRAGLERIEVHSYSAGISKHLKEEPGEHANQDSPGAVAKSLEGLYHKEYGKNTEIYRIARKGWYVLNLSFVQSAGTEGTLLRRNRECRCVDHIVGV